MQAKQEPTTVERAQAHVQLVEQKCRAQIGTIQRNLADARAVVEHAERRRDALQVAAATDATAAQELQQLHRDVADAKQRAADLTAALASAEAIATQTVDAARRELVAAQLREVDAACIDAAARFDR